MSKKILSTLIILSLVLVSFAANFTIVSAAGERASFTYAEQTVNDIPQVQITFSINSGRFSGGAFLLKYDPTAVVPCHKSQSTTGPSVANFTTVTGKRSPIFEDGEETGEYTGWLAESAKSLDTDNNIVRYDFYVDPAAVSSVSNPCDPDLKVTAPRTIIKMHFKKIGNASRDSFKIATHPSDAGSDSSFPSGYGVAYEDGNRDNPATDLAWVNFPTAGVKPDAPSVTADDVNNVIVGIDNTMEYNINDAGWVAYNPAAAPDLSGNKTVQVRVAAAGANPASDPVTLTFTTNPPPTKEDIISVAQTPVIFRNAATAFANLALPVTYTVQSNSGAKNVAVTWSGFVPGQVGKQVLTGTLDTDSLNANNLNPTAIPITLDLRLVKSVTIDSVAINDIPYSTEPTFTRGDPINVEVSASGGDRPLEYVIYMIKNGVNPKNFEDFKNDFGDETTLFDTTSVAPDRHHIYVIVREKGGNVNGFNVMARYSVIIKDQPLALSMTANDTAFVTMSAPNAWGELIRVSKAASSGQLIVKANLTGASPADTYEYYIDLRRAGTAWTTPDSFVWTASSEKSFAISGLQKDRYFVTVYAKKVVPGDPTLYITKMLSEQLVIID